MFLALALIALVVHLHIPKGGHVAHLLLAGKFRMARDTLLLLSGGALILEILWRS